MLRRLTSTSSTWVTVPLRLALGAIFIGHGAQKVLGKFNGPGWNKWLTLTQFAPFPFMKPAWAWLAAAALAELIGGILVLLGLLTRVGAFLITCVMLTAIIGIHWPAFFAPAGIELPVALLSSALALLIAGGGQASIDRMIGRRR
jgi:putative oxidoreductase